VGSEWHSHGDPRPKWVASELCVGLDVADICAFGFWGSPGRRRKLCDLRGRRGVAGDIRAAFGVKI